MPPNFICLLDESITNRICGRIVPHTQTFNLSFLFEKQVPISWIDEMQIAFDKMHALMAADALTAYPDHNKQFNIHIYGCDFQLCVCIVKEGCPVARSHSKDMQQW